jgi:hypothetical protein
MLDVKYFRDKIGLSSGRSGVRAFICTLCETTQEEAMNEAQISQGFPIERTLEKIRILSETRRINPKLKTESKLIAECKGCIRPPILVCEPKDVGIDPLHNKLAFGRTLIKIIVYLKAGHLQWVESKEVKVKVKHYKSLTYFQLKKSLNLKINLTGITGNKVNVLFDPNNEEKVLDIVPPHHRNNVKGLLGYQRRINEELSKSAISQSEDPTSLIVNNIELLGKQFNLFMRENFAWVSFTQYQHFFPSHTAALLRKGKHFCLEISALRAQKRKTSFIIYLEPNFQDRQA